MKTFNMSDKEEQRYREWYEKHNDICSVKKEGKQTYLTFHFTPTGIGDCITINCSCGYKTNVTDWESW